MRLIDADALKKLRHNVIQGLVKFDGNEYDLIDKCPTVDAVPVVRCENCKHGYPCGDEVGCYHPEYELADGIWSYKKDFFCAFGEPKEGADHEP